MTQPYIATIQPFGFSFAPKNWAFCAGQIQSISQNTALFSLIGTTYGGNGTSTFALPDARSRILVHRGNGPGLSSYAMGEKTGSETVTLNSLSMPQHTHLMGASASAAPGVGPQSAVPAAANGVNEVSGGAATVQIYGPAPGSTAMGSTGASGGSMPFYVVQPYNTLNFCIALFGIYPSRN